MTPDPAAALGLARAAHRAGRYAEATVHYAHVVQHALEDPRPALDEQCLSHCLVEWVQLGAHYGPALQRIEQCAQLALQTFEETPVCRHFQVYLALCACLGRRDEAVGKFLGYHASSPALAHAVVPFVWQDLIAAAQWELCAAYIKHPYIRYERIFHLFEQLQLEI